MARRSLYGLDGGNDRNVEARPNKQFMHWDGDVYINQDKDVKGQITIWF